MADPVRFCLRKYRWLKGASAAGCCCCEEGDHPCRYSEWFVKTPKFLLSNVYSHNSFSQHLLRKTAVGVLSLWETSRLSGRWEGGRINQGGPRLNKDLLLRNTADISRGNRSAGFCYSGKCLHWLTLDIDSFFLVRLVKSSYRFLLKA